MTPERYFLFVLASALLIATPGPNVALIVGTSLSFGARAGLMTVAGVNVGLVLQLCAIGAGLASIVEMFSTHFDLIRYAGAVYLGVLGIQQLLSAAPPSDVVGRFLKSERAFARGLAVAFANPKTLIFHAAFLPQFLGEGESAGSQLWLLVATFAVIAALGDSLYAAFAARARAAVSGRAQRIANKMSGVILLGGSVVLLAAGRR